MSDLPKSRKLGWQSVAKTCDSCARKKIPKINWEASEWSNLLSPMDIHGIPPSLLHFTDDEIQALTKANDKPDLPCYPAPSQNVERAVKAVSEASRLVYGTNKRHSQVLTTLMRREIRPDFSWKGQYVEKYNEMFH